MFLHLNDNSNCTLHIAKEEILHNKNGQDQQYSFNCRSLLEDILNINFNRYRNFLIQFLPEQRFHFSSPFYLPNVCSSLQENGIFPQQWKCDASLPLLFQTGLGYDATSSFYNALLLLKTNNFSKRCIDSLIEELPFVYKVDDFPTPFHSTLQMMLYDLRQDIKESHSVYDTISCLLNQIDNGPFVDDLLRQSTQMEFDAFCERLNLLDLATTSDKLKTIYLCVSNPLLNKLFVGEIRKFRHILTAGSKNKTGFIREAPANIFLAPSFNERFKCERYLRRLYDSYRQKNTYAINPANISGLLALIVKHADAKALKKCNYCNEYSFTMAKSCVCSKCKSRFSELLNEEGKSDTARRGNLNRFQCSYAPMKHILSEFYQGDLHPNLNRYLRELARDRIREKTFRRLKPSHLDYNKLKLSRVQRAECQAQDDAENALLNFKKNASFKYMHLLSLWERYMVPSNFRKWLLINDEDDMYETVMINRENLKKMAKDFKPFFDITTFERYQQLIEEPDDKTE